jgi:hypothetical protein
MNDGVNISFEPVDNVRLANIEDIFASKLAPTGSKF